MFSELYLTEAMVSMERVPSTLAELVAPLSEESFITLLRERKLTLLRGAGGNRYSSLLNWNVLLQMIERGQHPSSLAEFSLVKDSQLAPPDRWLKRNPAGDGNVVDTDRLLAFLAHGFSLAVTRIDAHAPHLKTLCDSIRSTVREQVKMGVIVTTGRGGAYTLHYDPEDLIILQVEGRKRWKIFGPPVVNPIVGMAKAAVPPEDTLLFDEILEAGDFLFLPAGNWHRCENESSRSVHLGIFFQPPSGLDVVKAFTSRLLSDDRLRIPLTRLEGAADLSAAEVDIKSRAMEHISKLSLSDFLSDFQRQE
jgi:JmjC domain